MPQIAAKKKDGVEAAANYPTSVAPGLKISDD